MQIESRPLFLASAVLLNSIGFIISKTTTLEELFPGYNCVLPPIEDFTERSLLSVKQELSRKLRLGLLSGTPIERSLHVDSNNPGLCSGRAPFPWEFYRFNFLTRGHVIVGVKDGDRIQDPCSIFEEHDKLNVYDTKNFLWVTLLPDEYRRLGPNRLLPLVQARDHVAAAHNLKKNSPKDKAAHYAACEQANHETDRVEREEEDKINNRVTTIDQSIEVIKGEYAHVYTDVFNLYSLGRRIRNYNRDRP